MASRDEIVRRRPPPADIDGDEDDTDEVPGPGKKGRDYTKYDVEIDGTRYEALSKRRAVWTVVKHLCDRGVKPEEIAELIPWRNNVFCSVDGIVTGEQFVAQQKARVDSGDKRRYFCDDDELIHCDGRTFAVTNGWGKRAFEAIRNLLTKFPDKGVSFRGLTWFFRTFGGLAPYNSGNGHPFPKFNGVLNDPPVSPLGGT